MLGCAALLAACGKSQSAVTRTVTAQAAQAPTQSPAPEGSTKSSPAKARALALAQAVNLRAGDVPGFTAAAKERKPPTAAAQQASAELQRCEGSGAKSQPIANVGSPSFKRGGASVAQQTVSSSVMVARSAAIASSELDEIGSAHGRSCLIRYLGQLFSGLTASGAKIAPVSIAHGTPPAPSGGGSFGLRVSTALVVRSVRVPFYLDILGFVHGATEVTLQSSGIPVPFPAAAEQQLYTLLLSRAKAHGI